MLSRRPRLVLAFAVLTGMAFPIFSPVIGLLGVFLTGSVTSSAALFGKLQQVTATHLGFNPVLTTSANLFGGVMGKLISPQSIAVACAATADKSDGRGSGCGSYQSGKSGPLPSYARESAA